MKSNLKKKSLLVAVSLFGCASIVSANSTEDWAINAYKSQMEIEKTLPIVKSTMLGSHNSYNSTKYGQWSFLANQTLTMSDQLDLGAEAIEIDVHKYNGDLRMCHGTSSHFGCTAGATSLKTGLNEIAQWVKNNRDRVIILYLEDYSEKWHDKMYQYIKDTILPYVQPSGGYYYFSSSLTKEKVLKNGKNIIIIKDGPKSENQDLLKLVYPTFSPIKREWEDTIFGEKSAFEVGDIRQKMKDGTNLLMADKLTKSSWKIADAVWSWNKNEPSEWGVSKNCAIQGDDGRWSSEYCGEEYIYACQEISSGKWATTGFGAWEDGSAACQEAFGKGFEFATPRSSVENKNLLEVTGGQQVWISQSKGKTDPVKAPTLPTNAFKITSVKHPQTNAGKYFDFNIEDFERAIGKTLKYNSKFTVTNERTSKSAQVVVWNKSANGVDGEGHGRYVQSASNGDWKVGDIVSINKKDKVSAKDIFKNQDELATALAKDSFWEDMFRGTKEFDLSLTDGFWVPSINLPKYDNIEQGSMFVVDSSASSGTIVNGMALDKDYIYTFAYKNNNWDMTKTKKTVNVDFGSKYLTYNDLEINGFDNTMDEIKTFKAEFSGGSVGSKNYLANFKKISDNNYIAYFKGGIHWKVIFFKVDNVNEIVPTKVGYKTGNFSTNSSDYNNMSLATSKRSGGYGLTNISLSY